MGAPGERYSARQVAAGLGVRTETVIRWIQRGWLRASHSRTRGYLIRRRSVRRLLCDYPSVARIVIAAQKRHWRKQSAKQHDSGVMESNLVRSGAAVTPSTDSGQGRVGPLIHPSSGTPTEATLHTDAAPTAIPPRES